MAASLLVTIVIGAPAALAVVADPSSSVSFTEAQTVAGKSVYADHCATCHGGSLEGAAGPALTGKRNAADLLAVIRATMPLDKPRSLSADQYTAVAAYILSRSNPEAATKQTAAGARPILPALPATVAAATTARPDDAELAKADDANWLMYNKDYTGQRYSRLGQITAANAARLTPSCIFQAGEIGSFENAPVVYDGMMYITTPYNTYALDPARCTKLWEHRYPEDKAVPVSESRGAAIYRGKLFRITPNGHLIALDAKTGKLLWDVWMADKDRGYWLSAAPIAYQGKVFIATAGADWGANGHIYAFDADNGRRIWTFDSIPAPGQPGSESWKKGAERGGGSFWSTFALDPAAGLLFVPIGNPAPDYNGAMRPGDNLFTNSVVALSLGSGKIAWWVQQEPHDTHDWDTATAPILYEQGGKSYMSVASKDGWLYIYDRISHRLVSRAEISIHKNADLPITPEGVYHCPGISGGADWNGPAYSPVTKTLFINAVDWCGTTRLGEDRYIEGSSYFDGDHSWDAPEKSRGTARAVDAASGRLIWKRDFDQPMLAAMTPTAGGVVFTGALNGDFLALDAGSGKTLYSFNTGGAVAGAPSTYLVQDKQYVAIASGNNSRAHWMSGGAMTLVIFSLPDR